MARKKKDIVRPGYQDKGKEDVEPTPKRTRKATWDGFQDRTPAEIEEECRKIREGWSEADRKARATCPTLRDTPNRWNVPLISTSSLEVSVEGILPMDAAPWDVVDELDSSTPAGERPAQGEDRPAYVKSIILNRARRKAG